MPENLDDLQRVMYGWTRFALTGDSDGGAPTSAQLRMVTSDKVAELQQAYPLTQGLTNAGDVAAFAKAVGYAVAAAYIRTPAGNRYAGNITTTKIGPVTKTRKEIDMGSAVAALLAESRTALRRIVAIRKRPVDLDAFGTAHPPHPRYIRYAGEREIENGGVVIVPDVVIEEI